MSEQISGLATGAQLRGINRPGAEYGEEWGKLISGWTGQTYFEWPTPTIRTNELNHFALKGMNVVRLPIAWERLQHALYGSLDPTYEAHLEAYVCAATSAGFSVVIDLHNYGRYAVGTHDSSGAQVSTYLQHRLGDGTLRFEHVANVWEQIAKLFVANPRVIFNLMNEQHDADPSLVDAEAVFSGYQKVLDAVRATGAKQLVLFPNTRSSDTHHWMEWFPQGGKVFDADAALHVKDTADNLAFDMHSYTEAGDTWISDIEIVTKWARDKHKRLFLSEFGTKLGASAVSTLLTYINANTDVWVGWTPWNLNDYALTVTNKATGAVTDTPQMAWYAPFY